MPEQLLTSIEGAKFGLSNKGNLVGLGGDGELKRITSPCVDVDITVGAENTNVRAITIQLKDQNGADIDYRQAVDIVVLADANGDAFAATGGSTGIAIGTDGALLAVVAKKIFKSISEADGDIDLTWTDTGTEAAYLGVILPNGQMFISAALTNT